MPGVTEFIGNGTEIDDNWHELIKDRYFVISEEEAKAAWPNDYQKYYHTAAGWYVGLDVFHTLHCVVSVVVVVVVIVKIKLVPGRLTDDRRIVYAMP